MGSLAGSVARVDWWALGILIFEMLVGYPPFFDDTPFKIYEKILAGKLAFPRYLSADAKDLIIRLLQVQKTKRLGNLKGGSADVKNHKWFSGGSWTGLQMKKIRPPIPIAVSFAGDSNHFEVYAEDAITPKKKSRKLTEEDQELFKDFEWW